MTDTDVPTRLPASGILAAAVAACFASAAWGGLPTAPTVINGTATFATSGNTLTINNSAGAIINWRSFSIGSNGAVLFNQPSASSSVLNRVTGPDPSQLLGRMWSNGKVFLINPAGIYFGKDAIINTAGLVASTLDMTDADFMAGRMRFPTTPGAGSVVNEGAISTPSGGQVYLVGARVENNGVITTPQGQVYLAAGQSVDFGDTSTPGVTVGFTATDNEAVNLGRIMAESGQVGILGAVLRQNGEISAASAVREGGRVFLRATRSIEIDATGKIDVSGTRGGSVSLNSGDTTLMSGRIEARGTSGKGGSAEILGDKVSLTGQAYVNVSGKTGGGQALVGGDYQGGNAKVHNASITYLGPDVQIKADATDRGDGGKVIVWADDTTRAYGRISAQGGQNGGNGGFAEVSGKKSLVYQALADLSAPLGQTGTLLLDPTDICISSSAGLCSGFTSTMLWSNITANLVSANVDILTTSGGADAGHIKIAEGYTYDSANRLGFFAEGNVQFSAAPVINNGTGGFMLVAGWDNISGTSAPTASGLGMISMTSGSALTSAGTALMRAGGGISSDTTSSINTQTLDAKTLAGGISLTGNNNTRNVSLVANAGNIDYTSSAPMVTVGALADAGTISINSTAGDIGLKLLSAPNGSISIDSAKKILDDNGTFTTNLAALSVSLISRNGSDSPSHIAISADVESPSVTATVSGGAYGGIDIRQNNSAIVATDVNLADNRIAAGYGNIRYLSKGDIALDDASTFSTSSGGITIDADGSIAINSGGPSLSASGPVGIHAKQNLTVGSSGLSSAGSLLELYAGGNLTVDGNVTASAADTVGELALGTGGLLAIGTNGSSANLSAPDGNIRLSGTTVHIGADGGIANSSDAMNVSISGDYVKIEGAIQATFNANVTVGSTLEVTNGGSIMADNNVYVSTRGNIIVDGASIGANNDVSLELNGGTSEIRLLNGGGVYANQAGGAGLVKVAFNGRNADGIMLDGLPVAFVPDIPSGFQNNFIDALPGHGMELLYANGYTALNGALYGTFGDGGSGCHYRGGSCGGSYRPTAYADVSVEQSFTLFRDDSVGGGAGQFGGKEEENGQQKKGKKPGRCS